MLRTLDFSKPFALAVDASLLEMEAVLMQPDDIMLTTQYAIFPESLPPYQRNYSVIEQELLAMILAFQHFEINVPAYTASMLPSFLTTSLPVR